MYFHHWDLILLGLRLKPTYGEKCWIFAIVALHNSSQIIIKKGKRYYLLVIVIQVSYSCCAKRISKNTKKKELGYFQVNTEILETRISSSSKFLPPKNTSSIFKFELEIS